MGEKYNENTTSTHTEQLAHLKKDLWSNHVFDLIYLLQEHI